MADTAVDPEQAEEEHAAVQRRYLVRLDEDMLRQRPLWIPAGNDSKRRARHADSGEG